MNKDTVVWVGQANHQIAVVTRDVVHCPTFTDFVRYFISLTPSSKLPSTINLSIEDVFNNGTMTPVEFVNCYTNFIKSTGKQLNLPTNSIAVSVRVGTTLITRSQVELLQKTDIVSINPRQVVYGVDAMLESLNERKKFHESWPSYLVSPHTCSDSVSIVLTGRQHVILNLITNRGLSNKQIARHLNISESTVKFHVGHILQKYSLTSRSHLIVLGKTV